MKSLFTKATLAILFFACWCVSVHALVYEKDVTRPTVDNDRLTLEKVNGNCYIRWKKASDDVTASKNIRYTLYYRYSEAANGDWNVICEDLKFNDGVSPYYMYNYPGELSEYDRVYYRLEAKDEANNILVYAQLTQTGLPNNENPLPTVWYPDFEITDVTSQTVKLMWKECTDNVTPPEKLRYFIWYKDSSGVEKNQMVIGACECILTDLKPNTMYGFIIFVMSETGFEMFSKKYSYATTAKPTAEIEFPDLTLKTHCSSNSVNVTWRDPIVVEPGIVTYTVSIKKSTDSDWTHIVSDVNKDGPLYHYYDFNNYSVYEDLKKRIQTNTEYDVKVEATYYNKYSTTTYSYNVAHVKTLASDDEAPTLSDKTIRFELLTPTEARVYWTQATDNFALSRNLQYQIYLKPTSDDSPIKHNIKDFLFGKTEYDITNLQPNTEYIMLVTVFDDALLQRDYDTVKFTTPAKPSTDVNGDGETNISDITTLVNKILGK